MKAKTRRDDIRECQQKIKQFRLTMQIILMVMIEYLQLINELYFCTLQSQDQVFVDFQIVPVKQQTQQSRFQFL